MLDWAKAIHEAIGIDSPRLFIAVFSLIGLLLFSGVGWVIDRGYRVKLKQETGQNAPLAPTSAPFVAIPKDVDTKTPPLPGKHIESRPQPQVSTAPTPKSETGWLIPGIIPFPPAPQHGPSKPPSSSSDEGTPRGSARNDDATAAAEHYRKTSITLKRQEIREAYLAYCSEIANRYNLPDWSPKNQLTRIVAANAGDTEPLKRAEEEIPNTAWAAVRVLVAFETESTRPMYMSYIFIGRAPSGDEVVASFDADKQWKILSRSSNGSDDPRNIMMKTIDQELKSLTERIVPDIRRLN